jgi:4'-phosphopantetheinyl transferase
VSDAPRQSRAASSAASVCFVDLEASSAAVNAAEKETSRLSEDERNRFADMVLRGNADAQLWKIAHVALRIALERHAGIAARGIPYLIDPGGRPRLAKAPNLKSIPHFNLSHTGGFALIAISHTGPIGVDIEVSREISMTGDRRQRIEAAAARLAPDQPLPVGADARFLQSWVRLEAAAKASGRGIGQILTEAGVSGAQSSQHHTALESSGPVLDLKIRDGCFAAVAGAQCSSIIAVETFPQDAEGLQRFLAATA